MTPQSVDQLEDLLSKPTEAVIDCLSRLPGDILVLGIAGKMGPSLARMIQRASEAAGTKRRVIGVSRFGSDQAAAQLESHGIKTIRCDLLDEQALNKLPDAPNVLYLAGMKFGSTGNEPLTWAMNTYLPTLICRKFPRSREMGVSSRSRHWAANFPSVTIMRGRMAPSCCFRNGSQRSTSSGSGLRLPGGRHLMTLQM